MTDLENTGIYQIINLVNGKSYIGSTRRNFRKRFYDHRNDLKNNKHHSNHFQAAFNKYGLENFSFEVLEFIDKNLDKKYFLEREQYYIDLFKTTNREFGYNIALKANLPPAAANPEYYGHLHSLRTVPQGYLVQHPNELEWLHFFNLNEFCRIFNFDFRKIQCVLHQKWDNYQDFKFKYTNEEINERYRLKREKYKKYLSDKYQVKEFKSNADRYKISKYEITFPDGHKEIISNTTEFSKLHNLNDSNLRETANGKRYHHKRFKLKYLNDEKNNIKIPKWLVINPGSKELLVDELMIFCKENNLSYECLTQVARKTVAIEHKGYRAYLYEKVLNYTQEYPKCIFTYKVITPENKVYFTDSLVTLGQRLNVNNKYLSHCSRLVKNPLLNSGWQVIKL